MQLLQLLQLPMLKDVQLLVLAMLKTRHSTAFWVLESVVLIEL